MWLPDGKSILYVSGSPHNPSLWRLQISERGEPKRPPERLAFAGDGVRELTISGKGMLVFSRAITDTDIWRIQIGNPEAPVAGTATRLISSTRVDHVPQYSADGKRIAFGSDRSGNHEIWTCSADGTGAVQLTSLGAAYTASPYWSPDGQWIAFHSTSGGKVAVYVVPAEGGAPRPLTTATVDTGMAGWSRDGRWVYVHSKGQVWKVPAHGGAPVPVTKNGGADAKESPDGRFLYYLRSDAAVASLWKMPASGGEETQVLPAVCCAAFDVSANGVYFIPGDAKAIQFLNFRDNRITTLVSMPLSPAYGLSLAPDGGSLLYSLFEPSNRDLMMVENVP